ncbi:Mitochondrial transcription termination factor family protein [Euphorbia peplus]|nr:Mitochondrial transcription termination factor family protein [Euphorbia peplus]
MSESAWKKKIEVMKSIGFSDDNILKAFKAYPGFLCFSEDNTRKKLNFYFNTMKLDPHVIILNPALLGYSIEKRIRPRHHVLKVLKSKKLITGINEVQQLFIREESFQDKFIYQFTNEVPALLEFYMDIKEGKSSVLDGEEEQWSRD